MYSDQEIFLNLHSIFLWDHGMETLFDLCDLTLSFSVCAVYPNYPIFSNLSVNFMLNIISYDKLMFFSISQSRKKVILKNEFLFWLNRLCDKTAKYIMRLLSFLHNIRIRHTKFPKLTCNFLLHWKSYWKCKKNVKSNQSIFFNSNVLFEINKIKSWNNIF